MFNCVHQLWPRCVSSPGIQWSWPSACCLLVNVSLLESWSCHIWLLLLSRLLVVLFIYNSGLIACEEECLENIAPSKWYWLSVSHLPALNVNSMDRWGKSTVWPVICWCGCGLGSCRISPPRFVAECGRSPLNQGGFVVLYFVLFNFSGLYLVTVACHLSF